VFGTRAAPLSYGRGVGVRVRAKRISYRASPHPARSAPPSPGGRRGASIRKRPSPLLDSWNGPLTVKRALIDGAGTVIQVRLDDL
jgi:hypothetical protein